MKKYRVTRPFLAFAKDGQPGDIVWLEDDQAEALKLADAIQPYEVKVDPPVKKEMPVREFKQQLSPPARVSHKRTFRSLLKKRT